MRNDFIVAIGNEFSGLGYFFIAIQHSHEVKEIIVKGNKANWDKAEMVIFLLKSNGWFEEKNTRELSKAFKSRCNGCNTPFSQERTSCPKCGSTCRTFSFLNTVVTLKKIKELETHQSKIMETNQDMVDYIQTHRKLQRDKDRILMNRWE